jgi:L,D-transpeptidase catalytic domain
MMRFVNLAFAAAVLALAPQAAGAGVVITVDKSAQRLSVAVDGQTRYTWPTSTARAGYVTPNGTYRPQRLARRWYSSKYHNSPMPYSIFFRGGYAVHGSYAISRLGRPASHGCVRLHPKNAAILFQLVREHGAANTRIVVTGARPSYSVRHAQRHRRRSRHTRVHRARRHHHRAASNERRTEARSNFGMFGPFPSATVQ